MFITRIIDKIKSSKEYKNKVKNMPDDMKQVYENMNRGIPVNLYDALAVIYYMENKLDKPIEEIYKNMYDEANSENTNIE